MNDTQPKPVGISDDDLKSLRDAADVAHHIGGTCSVTPRHLAAICDELLTLRGGS